MISFRPIAEEKEWGEGREAGEGGEGETGEKDRKRYAIHADCGMGEKKGKEIWRMDKIMSFVADCGEEGRGRQRSLCRGRRTSEGNICVSKGAKIKN